MNIKTFNLKSTILICLLSLSIIFLASTYASAQESTPDRNKFSEVMCRVLDIATGTGGKAFAAFAIISVGIGFFTGKVSWGLMIGVAAGIAAIFGAPSIVAAISGDDADNCKCPADPTKQIYDETCT